MWTAAFYFGSRGGFDLVNLSGLTTFNMDVDELIEEAFENIGGEHVSGVEAAKARRKLNLILIELQNKNIPLNKLDYVTVNVPNGSQEVILDTSYVDVLELNIERNGIENPLTKYGLREFHQIPTKTQTGRPSVWSVERGTTGLTLKVWPTSDQTGGDTINMMVSKRIEDVNASYQNIDLPYRYLPVIVKWLSYELSLTRQGIDPIVRQELKTKYLEAFNDAIEEDRERVSSSFRIGGVNGK